MPQIKLPADLPENWTPGQIVAPTGQEAGLAKQHGYNYLMKQVNAAHPALNNLEASQIPYGKSDLQTIGDALDHVIEVAGSLNENLESAKKTIINPYPVGSIYMSVNNKDPSELFGGKWESWGAGRVAVGVDTSQDEFNTVEKVGGDKYLQSHVHSIETHLKGEVDAPARVAGGRAGTGIVAGWAYTAVTGEGNSQNLQPYITCYMWKRTA